MAKANSLNAALLLVRCLENEGVKYVFGSLLLRMEECTKADLSLYRLLS